MISDRISERAFWAFGYVLIAMMMISCQAKTGTDRFNFYGGGMPIGFSTDTVSVGPAGGHYVVTAYYLRGVNLEYVADFMTKTTKIWTVQDGDKLQMDEITVHSPQENKIEIDVAPSDDLNEWRIGVRGMNVHGSFSVIQNSL